MYKLAAYQHEPRRGKKRDEETNEEGRGGTQPPAAKARHLEVRPPRARLGAPVSDWCKCNNCVSWVTQSEKECLCCCDLDSAKEKCKETETGCITEHPNFDAVCLNPDVLWATMVAMMELQGRRIPDPTPNRTYRLAAYRMFTWWMHRRLGKGNRRAIPACTVEQVRNRFPEPSGIYSDFEEGEVEMQWAF